MTNRHSLITIALLTLSLLCLPVGLFAQETFRNPAMEEDNEFEQTFAVARRLARDGLKEEAIKEFNKAAKLKNGNCAECFRLIGQLHLQDREFALAAAAFRQAIALKPEKEAELNNALGVALYQQNDKVSLPEAEAAFRQAIALSQDRLPKAHMNLGYTLIRLGKEEEGIAALKRYLEMAPTAPDAEQIRSVIARPRLAFETLASEFRVKSLTGEDLSLEKYKGKIVVLDFWATWCGPCIYEMPNLKKMWSKYSNEPFIIIGISLDRNRRALEAYLEKEAIKWPQYLDSSGQIAALYNVRGIPYTVLIDEEGVIRAKGLHGGALSNKVGDLLKKIQKPAAELK